MAEGARGSRSWQARRDILEKVFRPIQDQLEEAEARQFLGELTEGISPHGDLGWTDVDDHISQLRQRFRSASTPVDYKDVGNRRSEEHTSELQSRGHLVCRLLLEKKKQTQDKKL